MKFRREKSTWAQVQATRWRQTKENRPKGNHKKDTYLTCYVVFDYLCVTSVKFFKMWIQLYIWFAGVLWTTGKAWISYWTRLLFERLTFDLCPLYLSPSNGYLQAYIIAVSGRQDVFHNGCASFTIVVSPECLTLSPRLCTSFVQIRSSGGKGADLGCYPF